MPGLLANENFPVPALRRLRDAGVDLVAMAERAPGTRDTEVLALARQEGRWLVTYDRDYGELVFSKGYAPPPAIVFIRQGPYPATRPAEMVLGLLRAPEEIEGFFVVVSSSAVRRRALPKAT
jgi:predicted nuclease of predicted toxin-antitoxin system